MLETFLELLFSSIVVAVSAGGGGGSATQDSDSSSRKGLFEEDARTLSTFITNQLPHITSLLKQREGQPADIGAVTDRGLLQQTEDGFRQRITRELERFGSPKFIEGINQNHHIATEALNAAAGSLTGATGQVAQAGVQVPEQATGSRIADSLGFIQQIAALLGGSSSQVGSGSGGQQNVGFAVANTSSGTGGAS